MKYISRSYTGTPEEIEAAKERDRWRMIEIRSALKNCTPEEIRVLAQVQADRKRWDETEERMQAMRNAQETGNPDLAKVAWTREVEAYRHRWHNEER